MDNPNLFEFATSELSQDAFICWLLSWASKEYKFGDEKQQALNKIATDFLQLCFDKAKQQIPEEITSIEIKKQNKHIDILCVINEQFHLLIEDKVGTKQHSDQLNRYLSMLTDKENISKEFIIPIYLQTFDQSCYKDVGRSGFYVVNRHDLLDIFENDPNNTSQYSDIYSDYFSRLKLREDDIQSFRNKPINKWSQRSWIGFYTYLQEQIDDAHWDYVPNPSGGFMGFTCFRQIIGDLAIYLQLEQSKICFKVRVNDKNVRAKTRSTLSNIFRQEAEQFNLKIKRPSRFGSGKYMTFAVLESSIPHSDQPVNIEELSDEIKSLKKYIEFCADKYREKYLNLSNEEIK